jgi:hypothetical protein
MYLKMMSREDLPDSDSRKAFRLIQQVIDVQFERRADACYVDFTAEDGAHVTTAAEGNVYVLNDQGKTVASYGPANYQPPAPQPGTQHLLFAIDAGRIQWRAAFDSREEAIDELNSLRPDGSSSDPARPAPLGNEGIEFAFIAESPHFVSFV